MKEHVETIEVSDNFKYAGTIKLNPQVTCNLRLMSLQRQKQNTIVSTPHGCL